MKSHPEREENEPWAVMIAILQEQKPKLTEDKSLEEIHPLLSRFSLEVVLFFFFLVMPQNSWDLSSPTKDCAPGRPGSSRLSASEPWHSIETLICSTMEEAQRQSLSLRDFSALNHLP